MKYVFASEASIRDLHQVFLHAFSDYKAPLQLTPEQFRVRIYEKLSIRDDLSVVALNDAGEPVGFIFHTLNEYEGIQTVYNGGTGVIPAYRKLKIATQMYEWIMPALLRSQGQRVVLEVIIENVKAIDLYKSLGFYYKQTLKCFKQPLNQNFWKDDFDIRRVNSPDPERYSKFSNYKPSFIDTLQQIRRNWHNEILLDLFDREDLRGYIVFQPALGRVSQIGFDRVRYGEALLRRASQLSDKKELTILNIPEEDSAMISFLENMGFRNEIDQYEMEMRF